jgi:phenylpyruvate tautomerase PptA (4-oxalocrotonate tautomerase family)
MPLVRIDMKKGRDRDYRRAVADAVHEALVETVNVPRDDRFQIVTEHEAGDLIVDPRYLGIERSEAALTVQISLRRGRTVEMKQALYRSIVGKLEAGAGVRPRDVLICLVENGAEDWSFGNGVAQYAAASG